MGAPNLFDVLDPPAPVRSRRRPRLVIATVSLALVATGAGTLAWTHGNHTGPQRAPAAALSPASPMSATPSAPSRPADPDATATAALLTRLLDSAPVPPGATRRSSAPLPTLKDDQDTDDSDEALVQQRWWTAPGTVDAATAYVLAHGPASGPGMTTGAGAQGDNTLIYTLADTAYAQDVELEVTIAGDGNGVAVSILARAAWVPQRPAAATILDPTTVEVTVERMNRPTLDRVLGVAEARHLAAIVNSMPPVASLGTIGCPSEYVDTADRLQFTTTAGLITVDVDPSGCQFVTVTAAGVSTTLTGASPLLSGGGDYPGLNNELMTVLGLPARYGLAD